MMKLLIALAAVGFCVESLAATRAFDLPVGSGAHDVAPAVAADGPVYFTAQRAGKLGILDPHDGKVELVDLGSGSAPHGVIVGPDKAPWVTDGGRNAIVRVDPQTHEVRSWRLPADADDANLNTASFDKLGRIWFTGQSGFYGRLDPASGEMKVWKAPRGRGPYGITTTPNGDIYYASLAGNYLARVDLATGDAKVIEPPTTHQGARRVSADARGRLWVSYWNTGQVGCFDPATGTWQEWKLPGSAHAYAIWVDEHDRVWLSDWTANALVRFDPASRHFDTFQLDGADAAVRQLAGRAGEVWGAESARDRIVMQSTQ
jgi:virginiamycin B lyase